MPPDPNAGRVIPRLSVLSHCVALPTFPKPPTPPLQKRAGTIDKHRIGAGCGSNARFRGKPLTRLARIVITTAWSTVNRHHDIANVIFTRGRKRIMGEYIALLITTALVNNVVLVKFLGLCPFMGVSKRIDSALGMGMATTFVIVLAASVCWNVEHWVLAPLGLGYLRLICFILIIAAIVQFTEMVIHKMAPSLYQTLGIYLPLIATNCAVLGLSLINIQENHSFLTTLLYDFGSSAGFSLAMVMFAGMRERLALARIPEVFVGAPIAFVLASLMSLAFMGFAGLNLK